MLVLKLVCCLHVCIIEEVVCSAYLIHEAMDSITHSHTLVN